MTEVEVKRIDAYVRDVPTRMPFHFGNAVMEAMELAYLRVEVEGDAGAAHGVSASVLSPMWFDKDASKGLDQRRAALLRSLALARTGVLGAGRGSVAELHARSRDATVDHVASARLNPLTASFGSALVDLAVIDAVCRARGMAFHPALRADLLGLGEDVAAAIPPAPLDRVAVRHTVGLADPLTDDNVGVALADGLPETLEQVLSEHGVRYCKVKINREVDASIERLAGIGRLLGATSREWYVTLDANEDFPSMAAFAGFVERAASEPELRQLWSRTLLLEQPVHRAAALDEAVRTPLARIAELGKPVIIDESDGDDDAFARAWQLGYSGTSAKSCKGVLRSVRHLADARSWSTTGREAIVSAEDLTCPAGTAVEQDLAIAAALGLSHCERNGHHYVRGLDFMSSGERTDALATFPALYRVSADGTVALAIDDGVLDLTDVNARAFGGAPEPDWSSMRALDI